VKLLIYVEDYNLFTVRSIDSLNQICHSGTKGCAYWLCFVILSFSDMNRTEWNDSV